MTVANEPGLLFTAGSALCATAWDINVLIA